MVRKGGLEPPRCYPPDPKSGASANSATFAWNAIKTLACSIQGLLREPPLPLYCSVCKRKVLRRSLPERSRKVPGRRSAACTYPRNISDRRRPLNERVEVQPMAATQVLIAWGVIPWRQRKPQQNRQREKQAFVRVPPKRPAPLASILRARQEM